MVSIWLQLCTRSLFGAPQLVVPGALWPDDRGFHIQAHGGGVLFFEGTYYWFGEDRSKDNDPTRRYVACYASKDLAHWTFCGHALDLADPESFGPEWVLERPKVYYHKPTGKFVMYMHIDGRLPGDASAYSIARVGVATSERVNGPYQYQRSFRPLERESRDIGQFVDDDGSAYLIFESRPTSGFFIAKLSADYLSVDSEVCLVKAPLEGGAIVHSEGRYFVVGSSLTGWAPNPNKYATAPSLAGPWSEFKDLAPPETNTYGSQSSMLVKVVGSKSSVVLFMADMWRPQAQFDSRYLWMPLEINKDEIVLPAPRPWLIDVEAGTSAYP